MQEHVADTETALKTAKNLEIYVANQMWGGAGYEYFMLPGLKWMVLPKQLI